MKISIKTLFSQFKIYLLRHEKLKKERKIQRLEKAIEREDSEEKIRREMLIKRRSNVRRRHTWLLETQISPVSRRDKRLY
jgi:hypothetical protein